MTVHIANSELSLYHVFIRDLEVLATIGVYDNERETQQRVRVNVDLSVAEQRVMAVTPHLVGQDFDTLENVVDYGALAARIRILVVRRRSRLLETLAGLIAELCLEDDRVRSVWVRVEKPDIFTDAAAAGVEIERRQRPS